MRRTPKAIRWIAVLSGVLCSFGCSTDSAPRTAQDRGVDVLVAAASSGPHWGTATRERVLYAVERDGRSYAFRWEATQLTRESMSKLEYCLSRSPTWRAGRAGGPPDWADPGLVRADVQRCITSTATPSPVESDLPRASVVGIWLAVDPSLSAINSGGGSPLWTSNARRLGAMRRVNAPGGLEPVRADAQRCADLATSQGVIDRYDSPAPSQAGTQLQSRSVSIQAMIERFDVCLRSSGHEVLPERR